MIRIDADQTVTYISETIEKNGHEIYLVGGAVRDHILGRPVDDYDFATSALPEEIIELFPNVIPTGLKHGTVTVVHQKRNFEVTTFRLDGKYSDGRRPDQVTFSRQFV